MKTENLIGPALDWAVSKALGEYRPTPVPGYSTDWAQGGPIIERELISVLDANGCWAGRKTYWDNSELSRELYGPTPLIAAMRCLVASKLGDEIEIPEALL